MATFPFYDRDEELAELKQRLEQVKAGSSQMLVLTGRRRIGKTTLVNQAFATGTTPYLFFFVSAEKTEQGNLEAFWRDNAACLGLAEVPASFASFSDLFAFLLSYSAQHPLVVVMDEFQNCRMSAPEFFSDLQKLWDQWRQKSKMLLILAGSVASAMREITESPHAPLFGRDSGKMLLRPFSTAVIKQIFADFCPQSSADDLLTLYALTGGVPKYLELLLESGCTTKEAMVSFALRPSSFFVTEANILFRTEFKTDYALYFEILEKIANGKTKRAEVISCFPGRDISGQLFRLEDYYHLIARENPIAAKINNRNFRFVVRDSYLLFWFRFVYPALGLIEQGATNRLTEQVLAKLPNFTGRHVLEQWFRTKFMETGNFTLVGPWWDRKGLNEIDLVAINPFDKEIIFAEIKRNKTHIDLAELRQKSFSFLAQVPGYSDFKPSYTALSLEDL